jgi:hypothetical protein
MSTIALDKLHNAALAMSQGKKVVGTLPAGFSPQDILMGVGLFLEGDFAPPEGLRFKKWITLVGREFTLQARLVYE